MVLSCALPFAIVAKVSLKRMRATPAAFDKLLGLVVFGAFAEIAAHLT